MRKRYLSALEKESYVRKYKEHPEISFREFCEVYGLHKSTFCEWLRRYEKSGLSGLERAGARTREVLPPGGEQTERTLRLEVLRLRIENERLKKKLHGPKGRGWADGICSSKAEEFEIVDMLSQEFAVKDTCRLMGISRAGYYKWKKREPSARTLNRARLLDLVRSVHDEHPTHGYRWTAAYMRHNMGVHVSDNFIYKCYRYLGIKAETKPQRDGL